MELPEVLFSDDTKDPFVTSDKESWRVHRIHFLIFPGPTSVSLNLLYVVTDCSCFSCLMLFDSSS